MIKKYKIIFLGLILFILVPQATYAAGAVCDNGTYSVSKAGNNTLNLNGGTYKLNYYNVSANGTKAKSYCLDPGRQAGENYKCERMIDPTGAVSGVGSDLHAFDVAVTSAYYQIYEDHNSNTSFDRSVGELVFRWLMFNYLGMDQTSSFDGGATYLKYFRFENGGYFNHFWNGASAVEGGREVITTAQGIFDRARTVGNEIRGGKTYQELVDAGMLPSEQFSYTVDVGTDASMGGKKHYTVTFSGTPDGSTVHWKDFQIRSTNSKVRITDKNCYEENGIGKCKITVDESQNPGPYELYIDTVYYLKTSAIANLKILSSVTNSNRIQRMLIAAGSEGEANALIKGGQSLPITDGCVLIGGSWNICGFDANGQRTECKPDIEGVCSSSDTSRACSVENGTYYGPDGNVTNALGFYHNCCEVPGLLTEDEYDLYCPCGEPDINFIGACTEFNSDEEITNKVKDTKNDAQLKTCLFNKASTDAAGNTLVATQILSGNPYCKVSCIEEYDFTLPNAKYTTSGGYFSLSSEVTGKRTCYVNASDTGNYDGIDHAKFIKDLHEKSVALVEAQTTYNKLAGALNHISHEDDQGCGHNTIYFTEEFGYFKYEAHMNDATGQISVTKIPETSPYRAWTDGSKSSDHQSCDVNYLGVRECHTTCDNNGSDGSADGLRNSILSGGSLETYAQRISTLQKEIENIFKNYEHCVDWVNDFDLVPTITYKYDEPYQELIGHNNTFKLSSEIQTESTKNQCTGDVGPNYKCDGGNVGEYNQSYVFCANGSCTTKTAKATNARFMKYSVSKTATYKPQNNFSVYTPLGTIQLNNDSKLYTVLCNEKDCLPVALNTKTGVFNFTFTFSNIGQYNDSGSKGRLMGGQNSVFEAVELDAGYVCQYVNNCPDCDYVCVGDECVITDNEDCPDCPYVCQNCIFDGNEDTFSYRTVSINNLFPNKKREYGPNWDNEKGTYTKELIQNTGEEAYSKPEYEYEINANQIAKIKQFNLSVGSYLNSSMPDGKNSLECEAATIAGNTYENVICKSVFLRTPGTTYFTQKTRNEEWTLWPNSKYFTSSTKYSVRDGIGPSWR